MQTNVLRSDYTLTGNVYQLVIPMDIGEMIPADEAKMQEKMKTELPKHFLKVSLRHIVNRMRNTYLSQWYWKMKQRRGGKRAIIALARKLLVIIYTMLKNHTYFDEDCFEVAKVKQEKFRIRKIIAEARKLGLEVIEPPKTA